MEYCRRITGRLREPSYTYKLLEQQRVRRGMRRLGTRDPAYLIDAKDDAHLWAAHLGLRRPRLIATLPSVGDIDWAEVGDAFVLKPARGTVGNGVMLLRRSGEAWHELVSGRVLAADEVVREYRSLSEAGTVSSGVVLESLVVDPRCPDLPPIDYKVGVFYGVVGFVVAKQSRRLDGTWRKYWKVFGPEWESLHNPFHFHWSDETIEPPVHAEALLDMARRISLAVPRAFLRVDLFDDAEGPVFGEVTPEPGGKFAVRPDVDRRLGQLWEEAEVRLQIRAATAGLLTPEGAGPSSPVTDAWRTRADAG